MNNKTIIEIGFRIIWRRIMEIEEDVIRRGLAPSSISLILHKILNLIY